MSDDSAATENSLEYSRVILKPRKSQPFFAHHPWVFSKAIKFAESKQSGGRVTDGEIVDLYSEKDQWIARGIFNGRSRIRVRLYSWNQDEALDRDFWKKRLQSAIQLREQLGYQEATGATRLVYSEADLLSGIIIDRYADYLMVQFTSLSMAQRADMWIELLQELLQPKAILFRADPSVVKVEGDELTQVEDWGDVPTDLITIQEHGIEFGVNLIDGQKTGYYLDQRENRRVAASYFAGRNVLDLCCYTGGFSLAAAKLGKAAHVLGVDTSGPVIELAKANAERNGITNVDFQSGDAFETLDQLLESGKKFGGIVLDPPKFAKNRRSINEALRAYHRLNRVAVDLLEPGGILVTCSCSGHVDEWEFTQMLMGVAQKSKREIQILEHRTASPDHPLALSCLDTSYLKCLICRVV